MRQRNRQRLRRVAATGLVFGTAAGLLGLPTPAFATDDHAPTVPYSAKSSASILHVSADARPLGVNLGPLLDLKLSTAGSAVNSKKTPRSQAAATHIDLAAGKRLKDVPETSVRQTAPPDNPEPKVVNAEPLDLGVARVGVGHLAAWARWNESCEKPTGHTELTNTSVSLANFSLLPSGTVTSLVNDLGVPLVGPQDALVDMPAIGFSQSRNDIVEVEGQDGLGVQAASRVSLTQITLFKGSENEMTVKVVSPPTLTATATGTERSSVHYTSPILELTDKKGHSTRLDAPHAVVEVPLLGDLSSAKKDQGKGDKETKAAPSDPEGDEQAPAASAAPSETPAEGQTPSPQAPEQSGGLLPNVDLPLLDGKGGGGGGADTELHAKPKRKGALLRLSIGDVRKKVTPEKVWAEAATIRLEVLDVPGSGKLLDLALGELKASAQVPTDGIDPGPEETPSPSVTTSPSSSASPSPSKSNNGGGGDGNNSGGQLPITGTNIGLILGAGVVLVLLGRLAMVVARRGNG